MRILLLLSFFLIACSGNKPPEQPVQNEAAISNGPTKPEFNAGDLIRKINCTGDAALSFALYLPTGYTLGKKYPLIIFFDPHGNGSIPLDKYRKLADQYGYILIGSNDSKNGNNAQQTGHIVEEMVRSGRTLFNTDSSRIYSAGFSGGARVAAMLGLSPSGIQGIAMSGAGFPASEWYGVPPSVIVAMAGSSDMNLNEMIALNPRDELKGRFQLIRYNGNHDWPSEEIFENAFMAFECFAMKDKLKPVNEEVLKHIDSRFRQQAAQLNVGGRVLEIKLLYEAWIKDLDGLYDVKEISQNYSVLTTRPQYILTSKNESRILADEEKLRQEYTDAIGTKDTSWWSEKMKSLQAEIRTSNNRQRSEMLQRVQGYVSLGIYSSLSRIMRINIMDVKSTTYLSAIYRIVDPENTETWYLSSIVAAVQSKPTDALNYLNRCADEGFTDVYRIQNEKAFNGISGTKEFETVLNKIREQQSKNGTI